MDELVADGYNAYYVSTDVRDEAKVELLITTKIKKYGTLNGIVNNAGIGIDKKSLHEYTIEEYDRAMLIDQRSVFLGMKHAIKGILDCTADGFVINIASLAGITWNN